MNCTDTDMVYAFGVQTPVTKLAEDIAHDFGLRVLYVMKKSSPEKRIDNLADRDAFIPGIENMREETFVCGVMVPEWMIGDKDEDPDHLLEANIGNGTEASQSVLTFIVYRFEQVRQLPQGWSLQTEAMYKAELRADPRLVPADISHGHVLPGGKIVVKTLEGTRILRMPEKYRALFEQLEFRYL